MTHVKSLKGKYQVADSAPSSPKEGDRYFDTTLGALRQYRNGNWYEHAYTSTSSSSTSSSTTSTSSSTTTSTTTSSSTSTTTTSTSL